MSEFKETDKLYIEFVETLNMTIPDGDCLDYRDQDDYRAMGFTLNKIKDLEEKLHQSQVIYNTVIDGAARDTIRINELEAALENLNEINATGHRLFKKYESKSNELEKKLAELEQDILWVKSGNVCLDDLVADIKHKRRSV